MKIIKYMLLQSRINHGTEEEPKWEDNLLEKKSAYSEYAEEIAKKEAYSGEYEITDDGVEEIPAPTELDILDARLTYVEMMSGILEV